MFLLVLLLYKKNNISIYFQRYSISWDTKIILFHELLDYHHMIFFFFKRVIVGTR